MKAGHYLISLLIIAYIGATLLYVHDSAAQGVETDFDQDGQTDLTLIQIGKRGGLNWSSHSAITGSSAPLGNLGQAGQHVSLANWLGSLAPEIGVVYYEESEGGIIWKVKDATTGVVHKRLFGLKEGNPVAVSGGDYNGDGLADAAVVRLSKGQIEWNIAYDLFVNADEATRNAVTLNFGRRGNRVFYANPDATVDWIGYMQVINGKKPVLRLKNLITGRVRTLTRVPRWTVRDSRVRPFPVKQSDGRDFIGFSRSAGGVTGIEVMTPKGRRVLKGKLHGKGDVIVGEFMEDSGEEIALKQAGKRNITVVNPRTRLAVTYPVSTGIAVDSININSVMRGGSTDSGGGDGGGDGGDDFNGPVQNCNNVRSWPGSHIYKTIGSDHFSSGDPRKYSAGVIIKPGGFGPFPSCIYAQDLKGKVIANLGLYARGDGWEARYYAGWGCGAGTPLGGSAIGARARQNTGSSNIMINFGSVCYGPIDATRCIGSSQC